MGRFLAFNPSNPNIATLPINSAAEPDPEIKIMKNTTRTILALTVGLSAAVGAYSHGRSNETAPSSAEAAASLDEQSALDTAKANYPMMTCVVSGDDLEGGEMGEPFEYIHKEKGKPDRLVRLCCKDCVRDFKKDPARYLAEIDAAAAGMKDKMKDGMSDHMSGSMSDGHSGH